MSWPIKLRTMSFAITLGVVLLESVMGSILIALILWFATSPPRRPYLRFSP